MKRLILISTILISLTPRSNGQTACTYPQGFYGALGPKGCYDNATILSSRQFMLNAFGTNTSQVFGNVANRRFFTLYKTDITNGYVFKMLPGAHNGQKIGVDNVLPYNGAYYGDQSTWSLVPIQPTGTYTGRINNLLLAQTITLWFNIRTSTTLGTISLAADTLITSEQTSCGSGVPTGAPSKFGLPHSIILYLNGGNGYTNDVNGLLQLANDVLGGANTSVNLLLVQNATSIINDAFNGCRILVGTIPAPATSGDPDTKIMEVGDNQLITINAFPNPSAGYFTLNVRSDDDSPIKLIVVDVCGKLLESKIITADQQVKFGDHYSTGVYFVRVLQGKQHNELKLIKTSN